MTFMDPFCSSMIDGAHYLTFMDPFCSSMIDGAHYLTFMDPFCSSMIAEFPSGEALATRFMQ